MYTQTVSVFTSIFRCSWKSCIFKPLAISTFYHISVEVQRTTRRDYLIIKMRNGFLRVMLLKITISIRTGAPSKPFHHTNTDYFYIKHNYARTFTTVYHLSFMLIGISLNHRLQSPFVWLIFFCV